MRKIIITGLLLLALMGCKERLPSYNGSVRVYRENGRVNKVYIHTPGERTFHNKQDATNAIEHLESLIKDLKSARDQMDD